MKTNRNLFIGLMTSMLVSCGTSDLSGAPSNIETVNPSEDISLIGDSLDSFTSTSVTISDSSVNSDVKIVNEAIREVTIFNNYAEVTEQLQCLGQVTVLDKNENEIAVPITWTADDASKWTFSEMDARNLIVATPVFPVEGEEQAYNFVLTATANHGGAKATKIFLGKVMPKAAAEVAMTTAQAREADIDSLVTVEGIVWKAAKAAAKGFYVCDTTGCIYIYDNGANAVTEGSTVRVTGRRDEYIGMYNGMHQIAGNTTEPLQIETISTSQQALPLEGATEVTATEVLAFKNTDKTIYGKLYKTRGTLRIYVNSYGIPTYEVVDAAGKYVGFYPASLEANTIYAWMKDYMNADGTSNGKTYDVYYVIYDYTFVEGTTTFAKNRMLPYFVQEVD